MSRADEDMRNVEPINLGSESRHCFIPWLFFSNISPVILLIIKISRRKIVSLSPQPPLNLMHKEDKSCITT